MLADFLVPYKHYGEEVISGVLDEIVLPTDADSEEYPSESFLYNINRWQGVD